MANIVEVIIRAHDRTREAFEGARSGIRRLREGFDREGGLFRAISGRLLGGISQLASGMVSRLGDAGRRSMERFREHFDREGRGGLFRGLGRGIRDAMGNMFEAIKGAMGRLGGIFQDGIGGAFRSALSTPYIGPIIIAAMAAVAAVAAPAIAAVIAGALTLGMGAALVGVGAMVLLKNEKLKEKLGKDFKEVGSTMEKAFKPLTPVLEHVGTVAKKVAKTFEPVINQAMKLAAPHLKKFVDELGKAFEALAPAIGPLMDAFTKILDELGPELPGMFKDISESLVGLFDAVAKDPETIVVLFKAILIIITHIITVIGWLTRAFSKIKDVAADVGPALSSTWDSIASGASGAIGWVRGLWGWIRRLVGKIVHIGQVGASGAIGWVSRLIGTIRRFVGKIVHIGQSGAQGAISIVSRLIGTIRRFVGKVVRIGVSGVEGAINAVSRLIGWIRNLVGKTVNVGVNIVGAGKSLLGFAHGGIVGAAGGGPRSAMVMVGEQGRELVRLPFGSTVIPHGQTESMMASGGGGGSVVIEWGGGPTDELGKALWKYLKNNIRVVGGTGTTSVQKALGQSG